MPNRRAGFYLLLIVLPLLTALGGCGDTPTSNPLPTVSTTIEAKGTPPTTQVGTDLYEIGQPVISTPAFGTGLEVMGVIKYKGSTTRTGPQIEITLVDSAGKDLAKSTALTAPAYIKPQSNIPYKALFTSSPEGYSKAQVTISTKEADAKSLTYGDLVITEPSLAPPQDSSGSLKLTGNIKNTGAKEASLVGVVAVLYDAGGKVIAVESGYSKKASLGVGEESQFEIEFFGLKAADKFELFASGVTSK